MKIRAAVYLFLIITQSNSCQTVQQQEAAVSEDIRINQIGYYPLAPKLAVVNGALNSDDFYVIGPDLDTVFTGKLATARKSPYDGTSTRIADFSALNTAGQYVLHVPGLGQSLPVHIRNNVHSEVAKASMKSFYFQRTATDLQAAYAGKWARPAGHYDTQVYVHASAASASRPQETVLSSSRGWYDAGDYNKYIVNSGITMGTLFSLYEDFPAYMRSFSMEIPENANEIPDMLDESLWNLRWMLTMQDPSDGGVYHKLTTADFEKMIMPAEAQKKRYVVQKSTAATLDFSAVMAQAARIFKPYDSELPGLADSCLTAAKTAFIWAVENPDRLYDQELLNQQFKPSINTGAYGDKEVSDEFIWAAAELWATTGDEAYLKHVELKSNEMMPLPAWPQVAALGYYTLLRFENNLPQDLTAQLRQKLISFSDKLIQRSVHSPYATVMGGDEKDFIWGSNAVACNQAIALLNTYRITNDKKYLDFALTNMDYILGRNATGYSFVTGYGMKTPHFIHHRPSEADGIVEPVPGLLAGGPNPHQQDGCTYPTNTADKSYVDDVCSYASNEIAINWNAPFVYLSNALEALQYKSGYAKE